MQPAFCTPYFGRNFLKVPGHKGLRLQPLIDCIFLESAFLRIQISYAGADVTIALLVILSFHSILRVAGTHRDVRTTNPHKTDESRLRPQPKVVSTKSFDMPTPKNTNNQSWKIQLGHWKIEVQNLRKRNISFFINVSFWFDKNKAFFIIN